MVSGLLVSMVGVIIAALAGVLGVWMERDPDGPRRWAFVFSGLIVFASGGELINTATADARDNATDAKLATVLEAMSELAAKGNNPALEQYVGAELAVQARANPTVVKKMEKSIAAKGGDPTAVTRRAAEGRRVASGLTAQKAPAGERPSLGAGARATKRGEGDASTKGRSAGRAADQADPDSAAAKTADVSDKAGRAAKAVAGVVGEDSKAAAAAGSAAKAATKVADTTAKAATAVEDTKAAATKATDDAKKATDDAKKAADDAKKAKEDAKKSADKAKDALKGFGS
jgi:hypothetical protein